MNNEIKEETFKKIKDSALAVSGWDNMHDAWLDTEEDSGCAVVGHNASGELYPIAVVDCAQYDQPEESIKLAEFYASANPKAILELIAAYEGQAKKISELEDRLSSFPIPTSVAMKKISNLRQRGFKEYAATVLKSQSDGYCIVGDYGDVRWITVYCEEPKEG